MIYMCVFKSIKVPTCCKDILANNSKFHLKYMSYSFELIQEEYIEITYLIYTQKNNISFSKYNDYFIILER